MSVAGDNPGCEDKFHNNMTEDLVELESPCMGGRKGRDGLFPASDCIKVTGVYGKSTFITQFWIVTLKIVKLSSIVTS